MQTTDSHTWTLQDAKARFSELVNRCRDSGIQTVTRHGKPAVVVLPWEEYRVLRKRPTGLADFFAAAPRIELDIERSRDGERELSL
jgi:prevent-host-death family protein